MGLLFPGTHKEIHVLDKPRLHQRAFQRRFVGIEQVEMQRLDRAEPFPFVKAAGELAEAQMRLIFGRLLFAAFISILHAAGGKRLLQGDLPRRVVLLKRVKIGIDQRQDAVHRQVAVQIEDRVRRMVKPPVRRQELLIRQLWDRLGIAAAVIPVAGIRIQRADEDPPQPAHIGRGRALHLVEHHAVEARLLAAEIDAAPLLQEDGFVRQQQGAEHRVKIDARQVHEVLFIFAGNRITRVIGRGMGVKVGVERAFQQVEERLLDREALRAAEHRMLQDVEHARIVRRQGFERHVKQLVLLSVLHPVKDRAGLFVTKLPERAAQFFALPRADHAEAMDQFIRFYTQPPHLSLSDVGK